MAFEIIAKKYKWAYPLSTREGKPRGITLHNAAATHCTADDIHRWHLANGWSGIAYGAFITKEGKIYRGRPIWAMEAHALGCGDKLGICFEGNYDRETTMPEIQIAAGKWLVKRWRDKFNFAKSVVCLHKNEPGNSTSCPGKYFPAAKIIG